MVFRVFSKELSDFLFNSLVVLGGETYGIAVLGVNGTNNAEIKVFKEYCAVHFRFY